MPSRSTVSCPCGQPAPYFGCCEPLHSGRSTASTAEQLMRSRYSAFVVRDAAYLRRTWAAKARPTTIELDPKLEWTGLTILSTTDGTPFHTEGTVEFEAHYTTNGTPGLLHETSTFGREGGEWVYVSGR